MLRVPYVAFVIFSVAACAGAFAQDADIITPPHLMPADARTRQLEIVGEPREGVVMTSFTVRMDGSTADIKVIGGFYNDFLQRAIVRDVSQMKFEPARVRGEPIDYFGYTLVTKFTFHLGMTIVTPDFQRDQKKFVADLQKGDVASAEAIVQDMIQHKIRGLFEYAFLNESLVPIYIKLNRPYDALLASRQATLRDGDLEVNIPLGSHIRTNDPSWPYILPREMLIPALRERFALSSALGLVGEALRTYVELNDIDPLPPGDAVTTRADALRIQLQTAPTLVSHGRISRDTWRHALVRRTFTITNVRGGVLSGFDLVCGHERRSLTYKADSEWTLPAAWGRCAVAFHGDDGTEFAIVEMQSPTAPIP